MQRRRDFSRPVKCAVPVGDRMDVLCGHPCVERVRRFGTTPRQTFRCVRCDADELRREQDGISTDQQPSPLRHGLSA